MRWTTTNSRMWIHESIDNAADFGWQDGYGAFAVSFSNLDPVRRYIANQEQHHRNRSFEEEFIEFLERHEIAFDPRYLPT